MLPYSSKRPFCSICSGIKHLKISQLVHEPKIVIIAALCYETKTSYQKPPTAKHHRLADLLFLSNFILTVSIRHIRFICLFPFEGTRHEISFQKQYVKLLLPRFRDCKHTSYTQEKAIFMASNTCECNPVQYVTAFFSKAPRTRCRPSNVARSLQHKNTAPLHLGRTHPSEERARASPGKTGKPDARGQFRSSN